MSDLIGTLGALDDAYRRQAEIRHETFAEVAAGLNTIADIFERSGEDPCRVRICRELANAHRAYAEGFGAPCGSRR